MNIKKEVKDMENARRCLQEKIGSCGGCNIQAMALEKRQLVPRDQEPALIKQMSRQWCPEGTVMILPKRPKS
jgi:hypothetical protein